MNDLPASLDRGASVAQQSLESVGQAIDDLGATVLKGAAVIKNSILAVDDQDADRHLSRSFNSVRLSRFEEGLKRMKCDESTYCKDVEEKGEYEAWREVFRIGEKGSEIMDLIAEDDVVEEIYKKLVPKKIDHETFWCRYFYRLYKLNQVEEAREKLVKRAIYCAEEEDLSWDVEDDDEYDEGREKLRLSNVKADEKGWEKCDGGESGKESDISVVSARPSFHEGDSGWDEIEDVVSHEEGRDTRSGSCSSPVKVDLRKLSRDVEEDEELSWDIEDDESPKA